jgi:hypothetical protein
MKKKVFTMTRRLLVVLLLCFSATVVYQIAAQGTNCGNGSNPCSTCNACGCSGPNCPGNCLGINCGQCNCTCALNCPARLPGATCISTCETCGQAGSDHVGTVCGSGSHCSSCQACDCCAHEDRCDHGVCYRCGGTCQQCSNGGDGGGGGGGGGCPHLNMCPHGICTACGTCSQCSDNTCDHGVASGDFCSQCYDSSVWSTLQFESGGVSHGGWVAPGNGIPPVNGGYFGRRNPGYDYMQ